MDAVVTQTPTELVEEVGDVISIFWSGPNLGDRHWAHRVLKEMIDDVEAVVGRDLIATDDCLNDVNAAPKLAGILRDALLPLTRTA